MLCVNHISFCCVIQRKVYLERKKEWKYELRFENKRKEKNLLEFSCWDRTRDTYALRAIAGNTGALEL